MKYEISEKPFNEIDADIAAVLVIDKNLQHNFVKHNKILQKLNYKGEDGEGIFLTEHNYVYVGCESLDYDDIRVAVAKVFKLIEKTQFKTLKIASYVNKCVKFSVQAIVEGFELGSYKFLNYKSEKETINLNKIIISIEDYNKKEIDIKKAKIAIKQALIIANATNYTKDIINTIPNDYTPIQMAKDAEQLAKKYENLTCKVYDEKFLKKEGMNAFLAVNKASVHPPRLIHLIYKPENAKTRVIYVGKGLTYDSGGLSLKPSDYMITMKADKSGGAAVLGIIKAAAKLGLNIEIHGIIGATENMIGGDAYKPDDVLIAKNKKSIEVRNTDAEGRLVLADCLCYAQEFKPDYLIDMATLTGACVVALGEYTTGVMGHSDKLRESFQDSANLSGELTTNLYFNKHLKKLIKSSIADISNTSSSRYGGAITAGLFLDNFIKEENKDKWLHLDIAGPAFIEKDWGYNQIGASGTGVRMNLYWLNKISKEG